MSIRTDRTKVAHATKGKMEANNDVQMDIVLSICGIMTELLTALTKAE